jgi:hypothetical protein
MLSWGFCWSVPSRSPQVISRFSISRWLPGTQRIDAVADWRAGELIPRLRQPEGSSGAAGAYRGDRFTVKVSVVGRAGESEV